VDNMVF